MRTLTRKSIFLAGCGAIAFAAPALAQEAAATGVQDPAATAQVETPPNLPATDDGAGDAGDEIIVTAQNRAESVQDVPIAINVVSGDALREAGVADFRDLARVAPQLNITTDANYTRVAVRGVGTNSNDEAQDQSVAVNIDGEYINRPNILNVSLFDLDRVEVLRGPQGTLYGRNATGGAVNFITRKPGKRLAVNASALYGNYDHVLVEGGVDIPFGFGGLRLSGIYNDRDGYYYHPNIDARSGTAGTVGGRASLRLEPTDRLTVDLVGEYVDVDNIITADASVNLNAPGNGPGPTCALNGFVEVAPATPGVQCIPQNSQFLRTINRRRYNAPSTGLSTNKQESTAFRGRVQYDFGPATFTYTGGYRDTAQDADVALHPAFIFAEFRNNTETQSHELRFNGGDRGEFQWQFGAFYYNEKLDNFRGLYGRLIGPNGSFINTFTRNTEAESYAAFVQVDMPITDMLTAVGGLRYNEDTRTGIFGNYGFRFNSGLVAPTTPPPSILNLRSEDSQVTWLAGLNYEPDRNTLVYAKASTGYKAGGFDSVGDYAPETVTAFEGGAKLNFGATNRNVLNLAGYYYDYRDLQVSVLLNPAIGGQIFNAGKATIWGAEAEVNLQIDRSSRFSASFNYLNAEYDDFLASYPVFCVGCPANSVGDLDNNPNTVTQPNLAGNRLPQSPKYTITVGYDHVLELGGGEVTTSVFSRFKSSYFLDVFNFRDSRQEAFTQTDASIMFEPAGRNFSIQAFIRNIEDRRPLGFASFVSAGQDDVYNWQFGQPRTYGVRVGINF